MSEPPEWDLAKAVGILGTGEFARAMASRCVTLGLEVVLGSRYPETRADVPDGDILTKVTVKSVKECIELCSVIFVAVHPSHHHSLQAYEGDLNGKVLIDVSNTEKRADVSNGQTLAWLLKETTSTVTKAFNTVSAVQIESEYDTLLPVFVCGDDPKSKTTVMKLASRLGFSPVDFGGLDRSSAVEERNLGLFPEWGIPSLVMGVVTIFWVILAMLSCFLFKTEPYSWQRIPTNIMNKVAACISITCLSLVYLPGCIAGFTQLKWGTKHRRFPKSLDQWLRMRKQFGLFALLFGCVHMILSCIVMSPAYLPEWYLTKEVVVPSGRGGDIVVPVSSRMNIVGEIVIFLGITAIGFMSLIGLTSIPSVARALNWREWQLVHTYLGFACLFFSISHVTTKWSAMWGQGFSPRDIMTSVTFFACLLPWVTGFLKICIFLCYRPLQKIRGGWERGYSGEKRASLGNTSYQMQRSM